MSDLFLSSLYYAVAATREMFGDERRTIPFVSLSYKFGRVLAKANGTRTSNVCCRARLQDVNNVT